MVEILSLNALRTVFPLFTQTLILSITNVFYIGILRNDVSVTIVVGRPTIVKSAVVFKHAIYSIPLSFIDLCGRNSVPGLSDHNSCICKGNCSTFSKLKCQYY
jgi:hypothetical protein